MTQVSAVLEQIKPLVARLNDSEKLELIRTIAIGQSMPANDTSPENEDFVTEMIAEQRAWYTRSGRERQRFQGEYVAIYQGNVVDHDSDRLSLLRRVREQYGNAPIPVLPADQESIPEYVFHHPQLVS